MDKGCELVGFPLILPLVEKCVYVIIWPLVQCPRIFALGSQMEYSNIVRANLMFMTRRSEGCVIVIMIRARDRFGVWIGIVIHKHYQEQYLLQDETKALPRSLSWYAFSDRDGAFNRLASF